MEWAECDIQYSFQPFDGPVDGLFKRCRHRSHSHGLRAAGAGFHETSLITPNLLGTVIIAEMDFDAGGLLCESS